jgi:hypothetical protein
VGDRVPRLRASGQNAHAPFLDSREVVLDFRPVSSLVKMDNGFI